MTLVSIDLHLLHHQTFLRPGNEGVQFPRSVAIVQVVMASTPKAKAKAEHQCQGKHYPTHLELVLFLPLGRQKLLTREALLQYEINKYYD